MDGLTDITLTYDDQLIAKQLGLLWSQLYKQNTQS